MANAEVYDIKNALRVRTVSGSNIVSNGAPYVAVLRAAPKVVFLASAALSFFPRLLVLIGFEIAGIHQPTIRIAEALRAFFYSITIENACFFAIMISIIHTTEPRLSYFERYWANNPDVPVCNTVDRRWSNLLTVIFMICALVYLVWELSQNGLSQPLPGGTR